MTRYIFCPPENIPDSRRAGEEYISLYGSTHHSNFDVGDAAIQLKRQVSRSGIKPSIEAWDFCSIAMAVATVDKSVPRKDSADGWTRILKVEVQLHEPLIWQSQIPSLEKTLRFLTGDFWDITPTSGGEPPPSPKQLNAANVDCVSLLSGGIDSLAGAIDLCRSGRRPILVSKIVRGNTPFQVEIAKKLVSEECHVQWGFNNRSPLQGENSTRGRSIVFFAFAALVASSISLHQKNNNLVPIYVPENGFISLNLPLTPLRIGTLSTKTTHPVYLRGLQEIWDSVGIRGLIKTPFNYQFKTKGEILEGCLDSDMLRVAIGKSTSCGRYGHYSQTHCGRCVPCLVRRAAFLKAGLADTTEETDFKGRRCRYVFDNLALAAKEKSATDIRAVGQACLKITEDGIEKFIGGGLSFCSPDERANYVNVVERGIEELRTLLKAHKVL